MYERTKVYLSKQHSQLQQLQLCYGQPNQRRRNLQLQLLELTYTGISTHLQNRVKKGHSNIIVVDQISFKSSIKAHPCKVWYRHGMVPHKVLSSVSCYWLLCKPQLQSRLPSSWTSTCSTKCLHWLFFQSTYRKKKKEKKSRGWWGFDLLKNTKHQIQWEQIIWKI